VAPLEIIPSEDIRAAIARSGIPAYVIAARARIHPMRLSRLVRGHDPISPETASRILLAVQQVVAAQGR
jgi:plasmid maintenance system antidote protein VapI